MNHVDKVYVGAAEAFKVGSKERDDFSREDYKACAKVTKLFASFSDKQMALALLICMWELGRRFDDGGQPK